ncbi:MAG: hypothetical protein LBU57_07250 [Dysgonamonadaceae bacterium]|jgi:hypothetical protein|nr:hypothetical protein [Dysgonamonadaceae bacterium]
MKRDILNIKQLLDQYFEGQTSLQEEQILRNYFQQEDVDESLTEYKPMFDFFNEERVLNSIEENEVEIPGKVKFLRMGKVWFSRFSIGIAASIMLFFGVKFAFFNQKKEVSGQSIVYVDGKKFTDRKTIRSQTLNTLEAISESEDDVIASQIDILDSFNDF